MLRGIRRTRLASLLSLFTLACVLSLSASTLLHSDADDPLCNPVPTVDDHGARRIGTEAGSTPTEPEHCAICHWLSLRTVETKVLTDAPGDEGFHFLTTADLPSRSTTLSRQPARAPPAA
jgi:hypothetical protein